MSYVDARMYESSITRQHDGFSSRQRTADGGERFAPHQHRLAHGDRLESLEIAWQAPRQGALAANHAIAQQLNISGTPTFIVGGVLLRGYLPEEDMRKIVADERAG